MARRTGAVACLVARKDKGVASVVDGVVNHLWSSEASPKQDEHAQLPHQGCRPNGNRASPRGGVWVQRLRDCTGLGHLLLPLRLSRADQLERFAERCILVGASPGILAVHKFRR